MSKELPITESWKEVKEYIEYCFGWRVYCNAITCTSTSGFLEPHIKNVESALKVLDIIKKHKLMNYVIKNKKCANMYQLTDEEIETLKKASKGQ